MINTPNIKVDKDNISDVVEKLVKKYISNHKLSRTAHEEITSMTHSDKDVAYFFYKRELEMTNDIARVLENNGFNSNNIKEKAHIVMGLVENLCHEIVYHKHKELNYDAMTEVVIKEIVNILTRED